jgi:hypothetical protein
VSSSPAPLELHAGVALARARAGAFLAAAGDALLAAGSAVLRGEAPPERVHELLRARQRHDGCLGDAPGEGLAQTRRALGLLDDLRALDGPLVERACAWLVRVQADDGGFAEGRPEQQRIVVTGLLVGHLAKTACARGALLDAAGDFLAQRFSPERVKSGWEPLAAYAAAFSNLLHEQGDPILQWCGRELARGFATRRWDALRTARVLCWCDAPALPGAPLAARDLLAPIVAAQAPDGGLPPAPEADPAGDALSAADARVAATWDALVALLRFAEGTC